MNEKTEYTENLVLDHPISRVVEDNPLFSNQIISLTKDLISRNLIIKKIGSTFFNEELEPTTDLFYIPSFTKPIFSEKRVNLFKNYSSQTQRWIGHVIEIKDKIFLAKLEDLNQPSTYEIGEFDISDISIEDKEMFKIGAVFYWSVGLTYRKGQAIKESLLRFQRLYKWTESDYDKSTDRALYLFKNLKWKD